MCIRDRDESLTGRQKLELVLKEMKIGFCNGGVLGILSFVLIGLYIWLFKGKTLVFAYAVSGCIGFSLLLAMLISSAVGTCIPLFFKKIHIDPAVAVSYTHLSLIWSAFLQARIQTEIFLRT